MKPRLVSWFLFLLCLFKLVHSNSTQLSALLELRNSLLDPSKSLRDWYASSSSVVGSFHGPVWCSWSGVQCNPSTTDVIGLDLSNRNLSGSFPHEFRNLTSLTHLNLSSNLFEGPFQPIVFQLQNIQVLDISRNNFNSTFPPGVSRIKFLRIFKAYSNSFTGLLPEEFCRLQFLEYLNLGGSFFHGNIPSCYGNLSTLNSLYLAGNLLDGSLPAELGSLSQLRRLELGYNLNLSGIIPEEYGQLKSLLYLDISQCNLSGPLPEQLGNLTDLQNLLLFSNKLTGPIPEIIRQMKSLQVIDLSDNKLVGRIPDGVSSLTELNRMSLMVNNLSGEIPQGIGDLPCLAILSLWNNSLTGNLPRNLGSSGRLQWLDVSSNSLSGSIPSNVCASKRLFKLLLFSNRFNGSLPVSLSNCTSLVRFRVQGNNFTGSIPAGLGFLPNLTYVDVSSNRLSGDIPEDLGGAAQLQYLNISGNVFLTSLPLGIWQAPSLQIFSASSAGLVGAIPDFVGCKSLYKVEMSSNRLNGSVPWDIGNCEKLVAFNLSRNNLSGIIPWEISALPAITSVDLSENIFIGTIPSNFANCTTLEIFNVSFNSLIGPIPSSGPIFPHLHPSSFAGNKGLCGSIISKPCTETIGPVDEVGDFQGREDPKKTAGVIIWITTATIGVMLFVVLVGVRCFHSIQRRKNDRRARDPGPWKLIAFQRLNFSEDDVVTSLLTTENIIGMGATGTVYKVEMPGGDTVAVKKLWGKSKESSGSIRRRRGALPEVELLGNVRHRNIVRLLGCCSNDETTLLLYEYMPNGSLDDLLHGERKGENLAVDWVIRYKIALGVAQGICYLHHDCDPPIVHRDLKPSNILLDGEMEARVADFGVAKWLRYDKSMSVIAGSYGYIAPEYGYTVQVDEKSDIYSYGVVLMEIVTGKRSVDSEFGEGCNIVDWVRNKAMIRDGFHDLLDKKAGAAVEGLRREMIQLLRVALLCASRNPADRPSMRDVVIMLQEARPTSKLTGSNANRNGAVSSAESNGNS